jgi:hypothetical protein
MIPIVTVETGIPLVRISPLVRSVSLGGVRLESRRLFLAGTARAALAFIPALAVVATFAGTGAGIAATTAAFSSFRLGVGGDRGFDGEVGRHRNYLIFKECTHAKPSSRVESQGGRLLSLFTPLRFCEYLQYPVFCLRYQV